MPCASVRSLPRPGARPAGMPGHFPVGRVLGLARRPKRKQALLGSNLSGIRRQHDRNVMRVLSWATAPDSSILGVFHAFKNPGEATVRELGPSPQDLRPPTGWARRPSAPSAEAWPGTGRTESGRTLLASAQEAARARAAPARRVGRRPGLAVRAAAGVRPASPRRGDRGAAGTLPAPPAARPHCCASSASAPLQRLPRRPPFQRRVRSLMVVEFHPLPDHLPRRESVRKCVQIHGFVLE